MEDQVWCIFKRFDKNVNGSGGAATVVRRITLGFINANEGNLELALGEVTKLYSLMFDVTSELRRRCENADALPYGRLTAFLTNVAEEVPFPGRIQTHIEAALTRAAAGTDDGNTLIRTSVLTESADAFRKHLETMRNSFQRVLHPITVDQKAPTIEVSREGFSILLHAATYRSRQGFALRRLTERVLKDLGGPSKQFNDGDIAIQVDQLIRFGYLTESCEGMLSRTFRGEQTVLHMQKK